MTALSWEIKFQKQLNTYVNCCHTCFKIIKFNSQENIFINGTTLTVKPFRGFLIKIYLNNLRTRNLHCTYQVKPGIMSGRTLLGIGPQRRSSVVTQSGQRSKSFKSAKFLYQWMNKSPALRLLCYKTCLHRVEEIRQTYFMLQRKHHLGTCHIEKEFFLKGLTGINHWKISPVCLDSPETKCSAATMFDNNMLEK